MALSRHKDYTAYDAVARDSGYNIALRVYEPTCPTADQAVVIAGGWGTGSPNLYVSATELAKDRPVVSFEHLRQSTNDPTQRKIGTLAAVADAAANRFGGGLRLLAYSEGFIHAVRYANQAPKKVAVIDAAMPFGLAPTTPRDLVNRLIEEARRLPRPNATLARAALYSIDYIRRNIPLVRAEAVAVADDDILPDVIEALAKRIRIRALFGQRDQVSHAPTSLNRLQGMPLTADSVAGAGHLHFLFDTGITRQVSSMPYARLPRQRVKK